MDKELLDILACPVCKGPLKLKTEDGEDKELICEKCKVHYPIEDGIPNLLPPDLRD